MQSDTPKPILNSPPTIPQRCTSKKPNLHIETKNLSPFPVYRLFPAPRTTINTASRTSNPASQTSHASHADVNNEDTITPTSENEIVFPLDEAALSHLPAHLQDNMRSIQSERVRRVRTEQLRQRQQRRFHSVRRRQRRDVARAGEYLRIRRKPVSDVKGLSLSGEGVGLRSQSRDRNRGRGLRRVPEEREKEIRHAETMIWNPVRQELVPVYYRRVDTGESGSSDIDGSRARSGSGAHGNRNARLYGFEFREDTPLSQADTVVPERFSFSPSPVRGERRASSRGGHESWRSRPYHANGGQAGQNDGEESGRGSKWISSLVSRTRIQIQRGIQQAKSVIIKK
ncbi:hypothetical protein BDV06DRAFT_31413 [Aspergillus oleicola]